MNIRTLAWRNIGRNRRRSVLSMTAIAVATMSIVILFSVLEGMKSDMAYNLTTFYTGEIRLRNDEFGKYEFLAPLHLSVDSLQSRLSAIEAMEAVASVAPRISVGGTVFRDDRRIPVQAVGVDLGREADFSSIRGLVVDGDLETITAWESGMGTGDADPRITPVLVGSRLLEELEIESGGQFTVVVRTAARGTNAMTFQAAAVVDFPVSGMNRTTFWAPLSRIQDLTLMPDGAGEILVKAAAGVDGDELTAALQEVNPDLEVQYWTSIDSMYSYMELASMAYNMIALVFFLLASTVIVNTTMMVIFERKREIGMLSAMGMPGRSQVRLFFTESLILSFLGALAGLLAGIGITLILGRTGIDLSSALEGVDMEVSQILIPTVNLNSSLLVFVFAIAVSAVTTWLPTRRISRIEPVSALKEE